MPIALTKPQLDQVTTIAAQVPRHLRTSVGGFESLRRGLYGLHSAFCVTDINALLQALEWVPVRAKQILEEANVVCRHDTPPYLFSIKSSSPGLACQSVQRSER